MEVRPHPLLRDYYGSEQERGKYIRALFNKVAPEYDDVNGVMSLGCGSWFRRMALQRAGLSAGMRVLDVAIGTGLVAREEQQLVGLTGEVIGLDLTENMLIRAQNALGINCVQARAEALPIRSGSMDFVSMGYALRHVPDLAVALTEFCRVLRPSGRLLLLEFGRPSSRVAVALAAGYFRYLIPVLCRLSGRGRSRELWTYCWDTVDQCVPPDVIQEALTQAGFSDVNCQYSLGVFRTYTARRQA